jgi:hypothetical protein
MQEDPHRGPISPRLWERRDRTRADQDAKLPEAPPVGGRSPPTEGIVERIWRDPGLWGASTPAYSSSGLRET